jgi:hypothetical protein
MDSKADAVLALIHSTTSKKRADCVQNSFFCRYFVGFRRVFSLNPGRFSLFIGLISLEISRLSIHFDAEKAAQIHVHFDSKLSSDEELWIEMSFNFASNQGRRVTMMLIF